METKAQIVSSEPNIQSLTSVWRVHVACLWREILNIKHHMGLKIYNPQTSQYNHF